MTTLSIFARSRTREYFNGEAASLSSVNGKGIFDVLPGHENFVSLVFGYLDIIPVKGPVVHISIEGQGVIRVYKNVIDVYLSLTKEKAPPLPHRSWFAPWGEGVK